MGVTEIDGSSLLNEYYNKLSEVDQNALLSYAEFLSVRNKRVDIDTKPKQAAEVLVRPTDESVPKAIKRLSLSYPMLQDTELLQRCSGLMSDHILKGRAAMDVIDELELLFRQSYENYQNEE